MTLDSQVLVEWLSDGSCSGLFGQLIEALKVIGILRDDMEPQEFKRAMHSSLRDLSDGSILDFVEGGKWQVRQTKIAMIKQEAGLVRAVVCGARDSRVHLALSKLPSQSQTQSLGRFGVQVVGPPEELTHWIQVSGLTVELHWVGIQVNSAIDQLGATNARRATEIKEALPNPIIREGQVEVRRLIDNFRRDITNVLPSPEVGIVLEITEKYTSRRVRYVGTAQGWLKVDYLWAPWVCAASEGKSLAAIRNGNRMAVPLWARLPDGLSRAVTLASGIPWEDYGGYYLSGPIPPALLFNLKRVLCLC